MSGIPLHLQRRFEQRWAARFVPPVPKSIDLKRPVHHLPRIAKAKEKPGRVESAALVCVLRV